MSTIYCLAFNRRRSRFLWSMPGHSSRILWAVNTLAEFQIVGRRVTFTPSPPPSPLSISFRVRVGSRTYWSRFIYRRRAASLAGRNSWETVGTQPNSGGHSGILQKPYIYATNNKGSKYGCQFGDGTIATNRDRQHKREPCRNWREIASTSDHLLLLLLLLAHPSSAGVCNERSGKQRSSLFIRVCSY